MKAKFVIIITLVLLAIAAPVAYYAYTRYQEERRWNEELEQARRDWDEYYRMRDSLEIDSVKSLELRGKSPEEDVKGLDGGLARREILHSVQNDRKGGYDNEVDDVEESRSHPGTSPDDPMFGFDYWDDEDDAYEVERNQTDAYPDRW